MNICVNCNHSARTYRGTRCRSGHAIHVKKSGGYEKFKGSDQVFCWRYFQYFSPEIESRFFKEDVMRAYVITANSSVLTLTESN